MKIERSRLVAFFIFLGTTPSFAAQRGPEFPTHHYPTDESIHLGFKTNRFSTDANFVSDLLTDKIGVGDSFLVWRNQVFAELQPSRNLSLGAQLNYDSAEYTGKKESRVFSTNGFSDQNFFLEYRFYDEPGASIGFALVSKVPFYKNPSREELEDPKNGGPFKKTAVLGDAQTDLTGLVTSEYWPGKSFRLRLDTGYLHRFEQFSTEIPAYVSAGFVTPKIDIDFRFRGSFSLKDNTYTADNPRRGDLKNYFLSDYALSQAPAGFAGELATEFWVTQKFAITADYRQSIMGRASPYFFSFSLGVMYRNAQTHKPTPRTFDEKSMDFEVDTSQFDDEMEAPRKVQPTEPIRTAPESDQPQRN